MDGAQSSLSEKAHSAGGPGVTAPLISLEWAAKELAAQWPNVTILEGLPPKHRAMLELKASLAEGGLVAIRLYTHLPEDPHGMQRLTAAFHQAQRASAITNARAAGILQVGSLGGQCLVVVTSWIEGKDLLTAKKERSLDGSTTIGLIDGMAEAMETYHAGGWVHGYLTMDAFTMTPEGEVLLADHGLLDIVTGEFPDMLSPDRIYLAPELSGRENDARQPVGDVYSLGVIAYEWLTGNKPSGHFLMMPSQASGEGKWLDDVILRAIHSKPDLRIPSMAEFRGALCAKELRIMEIPDTAAEERERRKEREKKRPVAQSGVTAAMRVQFICIMIFSTSVLGGAIYFGIDRYKNQKETQVSMEEAVMMMGQVMAKLSDGEGEMDVEALMEDLSKADPEVALEAMQEQLAQLEGAGSREEALALAREMAGAFDEVDGPAAEEIRAIYEQMLEADSEYDKQMAAAERARQMGDDAAEYAALKAALAVAPDDPEALRRLAQTPRGFVEVWAHVGAELQRLNPTQTEWHVTAHRVVHGLELDLSGHAHLINIAPVANLPLDWVDVSHTGVRDLSPLSGLGLKAVRADYSQVDDLEQFSSHPLERLSLVGAPVKDYEALGMFPYLRYLNVNEDAGVLPTFPLPVNHREWENELGMRFLAHPKESKQWVAARELTKLDYAAFASADDPLLPRVERGGEDSGEWLQPVVLDLQTALAFCDWLTDLGIAKGSLAPGSVYRLPEPRELREVEQFVEERAAAREAALAAAGGAPTPAEDEDTSEDAVPSATPVDQPEGKSPIKPVAQGPCIQGYFDVLGNAEEWALSYGDLLQFRVRKKGATALNDSRGRLGLRLVLDLSRARKPEVEPAETLVGSDGEETTEP